MYRHSSRRIPSFGKSFLAEHLRGKRSYDRMAIIRSNGVLIKDVQEEGLTEEDLDFIRAWRGEE